MYNTAIALSIFAFTGVLYSLLHNKDYHDIILLDNNQIHLLHTNGADIRFSIDFIRQSSTNTSLKRARCTRHNTTETVWKIKSFSEYRHINISCGETNRLNIKDIQLQSDQHASSIIDFNRNIISLVITSELPIYKHVRWISAATANETTYMLADGSTILFTNTTSLCETYANTGEDIVFNKEKIKFDWPEKVSGPVSTISIGSTPFLYKIDINGSLFIAVETQNVNSQESTVIIGLLVSFIIWFQFSSHEHVSIRMQKRVLPRTTFTAALDFAHALLLLAFTLYITTNIDIGRVFTMRVPHMSEQTCNVCALLTQCTFGIMTVQCAIAVIHQRSLLNLIPSKHTPIIAHTCFTLTIVTSNRSTLSGTDACLMILATFAAFTCMFADILHAQDTRQLILPMLSISLACVPLSFIGFSTITCSSSVLLQIFATSNTCLVSLCAFIAAFTAR